jgi:hypothetical protein
VGWERRRRRNKGRKCQQRGCVYNGFYRWNHQRIHSVGESATSLYNYLSFNPLVIPLVKSSEKTPRHHTVASFQTNFIGHRRYGRYIPTEYLHRYIPTVSPTDLFCRYIPTYFETELFSSTIITDEKITSVIPLVFASFLIVLLIILTLIILFYLKYNEKTRVKYNVLN